MNLQQIDTIQSAIDTFSEALYDVKEALIDKKELTHNTVYSYLNSGSQLLVQVTDSLVLPVEKKQSIAEKQIIKMICDASKLTESELQRNNRVRKNIYRIPRQIHVAILQATFGYSTTQAAAVYGQDHATALNSLKKVNNYLDTEQEFRDKYGYIFLFCQTYNDLTKTKLHIDKLIPKL